MADSQEIREILSQFENVNGKRTLSLVFPNDVETYFCAFELVNSRDETEEYFLFPIMPSQMDYSFDNILNIKKTATSVVSMGTDSFIPFKINLSGNFGRTFKILIRKEGDTFFKAYSFRNESGKGISKERDLSLYVKSGYGCYKLLERIYEKSKMLDQDGKPKTLYFYNPAINKNNIVKINSLKPSQNDSSNNMIWSYNLQMTAVADLSEIVDRRQNFLQRTSNLTLDFLQRASNTALRLGLNLASK